MSEVDNKNYSKKNRWFFFTLAYLVVDYGRPQDYLPIGFLHPGCLRILILVYYLASNNGLSLSKSKQTKLIWYFVILTVMYIPFGVTLNAISKSSDDLVNKHNS